MLIFLPIIPACLHNSAYNSNIMPIKKKIKNHDKTQLWTSWTVLNHNTGLYVALKDCSCLLEKEFDKAEKLSWMQQTMAEVRAFSYIFVIPCDIDQTTP